MLFCRVPEVGRQGSSPHSSGPAPAELQRVPVLHAPHTLADERLPSLLNFPDSAGYVLPGLLHLLPFTLEALQLFADKRGPAQSALEGMRDAVLLHSFIMAFWGHEGLIHPEGIHGVLTLKVPTPDRNQGSKRWVTNV